MILLSARLATTIGWSGPITMATWYFTAAILINKVSPHFGALNTKEKRLESELRSAYASISLHSQEIAFYRGNNFERHRLKKIIFRLKKHITQTLQQRLAMGCFDSLLVKYGAVLLAYIVLGGPSLYPSAVGALIRKPPNSPPRGLVQGGDMGGEEGVEVQEIVNPGNAAKATELYVRNSSLLINLAKAVGRLVVCYTDVHKLAGNTTLLHQSHQVLVDLQCGVYKAYTENGEEVARPLKGLGQIKTSSIGEIIFKNVDIGTPNGVVLIHNLSFRLSRGDHLFVRGPNGSGKSSLFRVMGQLWSLPTGTIVKPPPGDLFYVPQRPYLPQGSLRDQVMYPSVSSTHDELTSEIDKEIKRLMEVVRLTYLVDRCPQGLDTHCHWDEVLSGGEKQRLAFARMFYHKPAYAILDEATSAMSQDAECFVYDECVKHRGITVISISHRRSLLKYHTHLLDLDGKGGYEFRALASRDRPYQADEQTGLPSQLGQLDQLTSDPHLAFFSTSSESTPACDSATQGSEV
eukprot:GHVN01079357.1.p1 GENE.GHVN01079357.1~~GHVN01079357.1.p1  ORF type:complete len:519 (+),score=90.49 GHVN01079357.1:1598-3154(+)